MPDGKINVQITAPAADGQMHINSLFARLSIAGHGKSSSTVSALLQHSCVADTSQDTKHKSKQVLPKCKVSAYRQLQAPVVSISNGVPIDDFQRVHDSMCLSITFALPLQQVSMINHKDCWSATAWQFPQILGIDFDAQLIAVPTA